MFAETKAFSGFAVPDVEQASEFYEGTLGLNASVDNDLLILHLAGGRDTLVYRSRITRPPRTRSLTSRSTTSTRQSIS